MAAFIVAWGLVGLVPTAAMAQFPMPMIPNFNFGPQQHYRSGSSHYSTHHSSRHEEDTDKTPDKSKEKDATQPEPNASASAQHQQQMSGPPPSHDAAPSAAPQRGSQSAAGEDQRRPAGVPALALTSSAFDPPDPPAFCPSAASIRQERYLAFPPRAELYARDCRL